MATTSYFLDQRQFLVSIATCKVGGTTFTFPGYWGSLSGGDLTVPTVKSFDGGDPAAQVVFGNPVISDLTTLRNFNALQAAVWYPPLKSALNKGWAVRTTIKQVATDPGFSSLGQKPDTWTGVLTGVTTPKLDATKTGATTATVALIWSITQLT